MYETLAKQGTKSAGTGLAGIDSSKLKKLRNNQLRECFNLIDEMRHKLEFVARIKGVSYVDDAASRTVFSTWYALETLEGEAVWIANGLDADRYRTSGFNMLRSMVESKVKCIVCVGSSDGYRSAFGDVVGDIVSVQSVPEAVAVASKKATENMKVLFSPAVENGVSYEEQGDLFKRGVNEL